MQSALEHYSKIGSYLKMSTGSAELDSLLDGVQEDSFYLFYGDSAPLDALSHRLIVNCILSVNNHGFESMALCFNNTDYSGRGKMILNPEKIANTAKAVGIEPKIVSRNLLVQTAYNSQHQIQIANEVAKLLENNQGIKLVLINNLTKFFKDGGQKRPEIANAIKDVISIINRACAKNKISLVATGDSNISSRGMIPRPIGGTYLKHLANVIVFLKDITNNIFSPTFKATVIKHQYVKTPQSILIHGRKCGRMTLLI